MEKDAYQAHEMDKTQLERIIGLVETIKERSSFYRKKYDGISTDISSREDFEKLPFTDKADLREAYPLGLAAVPEEQIVRIHSSSGTTGTPVIIPYTAQDVTDWAILFERCYRTASVTKMDRVHITPGYGLWTAGIGFQAGAERLGAMAIPMGPGNTEKQLKIMQDLQSTVICATSSYALLLAEEIAYRGIQKAIKLRKALIGSERWGHKMRKRIEMELGAKLYDIYGLTEIYGPGIAISCDEENGMHYWNDYLYFEIIHPKTNEQMPPGEIGELVITTLKKEGAPLIRYRTHDLTRFLAGDCNCGNKFPRIDTIIGRTDDMVKVRGTILYPAQIDELLREVEHVSSEYQLIIDHINGRDLANLLFESDAAEGQRRYVEDEVRRYFKSKVGITIVPKAVGIGELPRSEKKSTRIFDNRY